ncbi:MAG TPA: CHAP domain-containing protein [Actinophytocola sp.]|uniref:C40 family peptidase n=1 Tax=Actinophytocola sp. TaxID=1872138 RepID=UPI002DBD2B3A|nr:CHAP domain-containing protein [Actinophytocola sp.]HEU5473981.1 CHAP domain-containing protein [Actinophytocola sp.]
MDTRLIARKVAGQLIEHRDRLAGKAEDAQRAHEVLAAGARAITEHRDAHHRDAATATSHWDGSNAGAFDRRARRVTKSLEVTAASAGRGAEIVGTAAAALDGGHRAVVRLVEEYTTRAAAALDAGLAVKGAGAQAALVRAVGQVVDLVRDYTGESAKQLAAVQHQLRESATALRALERTVEHDGFVDPTRTRRPKGKAQRRKPDRKPRTPDGQPTTRSGTTNKIKKVARSQLGYHEGPGNRNKYGPAAAWCSSFATWVWRKSGVNIPILPFTGDVYRWGQRHGLAYGNRNLGQVRPGDVLLFGTGPQSTSTSTHIGIVESVHGNQVTLIEGNSGDRVQRVTHTLSGSTFYGGVHPR